MLNFNLDFLNVSTAELLGSIISSFTIVFLFNRLLAAVFKRPLARNVKDLAYANLTGGLALVGIWFMITGRHSVYELLLVFVPYLLFFFIVDLNRPFGRQRAKKN